MSSRAAERLRVRNNQRRSRERRKEYTQELEKRLYDLERKGVTASVEIQAAARKVAEENALLWELVRRAGLPIEDVEYHLHNRGSGGSVASLARLLGQSQDTGTAKPVLDNVSSAEPRSGKGLIEARGSPERDTEASERSLSRSPPTLRHASQRDTSRDGNSPLARFLEMPDRAADDSMRDDNDSGPAGHRPATPKSPLEALCRYPRADERGTGRLKNATSCEIAARIIASMRGIQSSEDIQDELGCRESKDCVVDNMIVFQAMDR